MKYTVRINPGSVREGKQRWFVEIEFHPGYEHKNCATQTEAEMWIGDQIMNHAVAYADQHGDAMEKARR